LVAHRRALPWVATVLSPMSFLSSCDPPVIAGAAWFRQLRALGPKPYRFLFELLKRTARAWEAPLRDFREELGLSPSKYMAIFEGQFSPLRNLALFDPQLAQPQPDWPSNVHMCGSPIYDGGAAEPDSLRDLERFLARGEAPIVFALGSSAVWIAGNFWREAIVASQRLGRRAVMITGPAQLGTLPPTVRAFSYLHYSAVFPRAAALVHQAGIGTLALAMRAGRPQLLVPVAFDQPDKARRAAALDVARVLPFERVTARRLVTELQPLLNEPHYAEQARTLSASLAKLSGAACAADELIACARAMKFRDETRTHAA
jgi:UDP:flavonoid glycosyltransferase YjiC (YdhE family)